METSKHSEPQGSISSAVIAAALDDAIALAGDWRDKSLRVVLTNGCFDLLHLGHVRYLRAARDLGDRLIVGLNDDSNVRILKGLGRPLTPLVERAEILADLRSVDLVVPFHTPTAEPLLRALKPDVYVKGGDYDDVGNLPPEAVLARSMGIQVQFLPYVAGHSTSKLIARIGGRASTGAAGQ